MKILFLVLSFFILCNISYSTVITNIEIDSLQKHQSEWEETLNNIDNISKDGSDLQLLIQKATAADLIPLSSPNREVEDAIRFLETIDPADRPFIRLFTTYDYPSEKRNELVYSLSFIMHSLVGISDNPKNNAGSYYPLAIKGNNGEFIPRQNVPNSNTLWWIDIRDYNWSPQSIEKISLQDAYFIEPIIRHENNSLLRLLAGNAIFRASWFVTEASNTQKQEDNDREPIYDILLYSLSNRPNTADEWRKHWGVDIKKSRAIGNEFGALIDKSGSGEEKPVSRNNRTLFYNRGELGWIYETYDVKNQEGKRDYIENFPKNAGDRPFRDGGEIIATNQLQLQVYAITDANEKVVNVADAQLVSHPSDVIGDVRVRTASSCFDCHAEGLIEPINIMTDYLGTIKFRTIEDKRNVDRIFLNGRFNESINDNKLLYARALKKVNGLTPKENFKALYNVMSWYAKDITLRQAAIECGISVENFISTMKNKKKLPGRIALLLNNERSKNIPRDVWASPGTDGIPGMFQQSMILIHGLTKITKDEIIEVEVDNNIKQKIIKNEIKKIVRKVSKNGVLLRDGKKIIAILSKGVEVEVLSESLLDNQKWLRVRHGNFVGFVMEREVK